MLTVMDESEKNPVAIRLFRKLTARERLRELADAPSAERDPELARLKYYLAGWAAQSEPATMGRGVPGQVPYADYMRPTASWDLEGEVDRLDASIRRAIDEAVLELSGKIPLCRPVLMTRYMNINGPAVYRSGRTYRLTRGEIEDIADEAEGALVPIVKHRGVVL